MICISETWLHNNISNVLMNFVGYKSYRQDRQGNLDVKQWGVGLMVYITTSLFGFSNVIAPLCNMSITMTGNLYTEF